MSRKSSSLPSLPAVAANDPLPLLGFTAWVRLRSEAVASVLAFRGALDRHLERQGLVRSMNPLHMLVWSPDREVGVTDQVDLLAWMALEGCVDRVTLGSLQPHCGIPSLLGRGPVVSAQVSDPRWLPLFQAYAARQCSAVEMLELVRLAEADLV